MDIDATLAKHDRAIDNVCERLALDGVEVPSSQVWLPYRDMVCCEIMWDEHVGTGYSEYEIDGMYNPPVSQADLEQILFGGYLEYIGVKDVG